MYVIHRWVSQPACCIHSPGRRLPKYGMEKLLEVEFNEVFDEAIVG